MLRIIQGCFDPGSLIQDLFPQLPDFVRQSALQLAHRGFHRIAVFCLDQVHDCFRLAEIHLSVQEGAF